uniref:Uncharacterized protein n=1 Tax=Leersia perrieri TaxID=77586 RepID=A0A0D9X5X8_9ORYZ
MPVAGEDVNGCGDDDLKLDSPNLVLIRRAALPLLEPRRLENGDCWPPSVPVGARRSRKLDLPSPGPSESPLPLPADELPGLSPIFSGANQATARSIASCIITALAGVLLWITTLAARPSIVRKKSS